MSRRHRDSNNRPIVSTSRASLPDPEPIAATASDGSHRCHLALVLSRTRDLIWGFHASRFSMTYILARFSTYFEKVGAVTSSLRAFTSAIMVDPGVGMAVLRAID